MFLTYDWPFLHVCILQENVLFSTLILGLVFNDCVVFYWDFDCHDSLWVFPLCILQLKTIV